ncbi:MAG: hypothetical protein WC193_05310 [Bacilli bacterium]
MKNKVWHFMMMQPLYNHTYGHTLQNNYFNGNSMCGRRDSWHAAGRLQGQPDKATTTHP